MTITSRVKFIDSTSDILNYFEKKTSPKRHRLKLSQEQVNILETNFGMDSHPSHMTKTFLSNKLEIPLRNIQIWFQNRRAKDKNSREKKDEDVHKKRYESYFY